MIVASCPSCEKRFSKGDEVELRPVKNQLESFGIFTCLS